MINTRILEALDNAYLTMKQYNYDPNSQLLGYLLTDDVTFITSRNNARMKMLEFDREDILELLLEVFWDVQPMNEFSGNFYNAAKNMVFVYQTMKGAGYDPVRQIVGFLVMDDVSYVSVKNGARKKMSEYTVKEYCSVLISAYISSRRDVY